MCGAVSASAYTGRDGKPRASLEVTAEDAEFLSSASGESQQQIAPDTNGFTPIDAGDELPF